jgi:hypothetical protein
MCERIQQQQQQINDRRTKKGRGDQSVPEIRQFPRRGHKLTK